jgi:hypothetical protein
MIHPCSRRQATTLLGLLAVRLAFWHTGMLSAAVHRPSNDGDV